MARNKISVKSVNFPSWSKYESVNVQKYINTRFSHVSIFIASLRQAYFSEIFKGINVFSGPTDTSVLTFDYVYGTLPVFLTFAKILGDFKPYATVRSCYDNDSSSHFLKKSRRCILFVLYLSLVVHYKHDHRKPSSHKTV